MATKNSSLHRISEASEPCGIVSNPQTSQVPVSNFQQRQPPPDISLRPAGQKAPTNQRAHPVLQEDLLTGGSSSYQALPTDPNLSPYSKDLHKLQKLIKFNFRKFSDAPVTTSEFYRIGRVLGRGAFGKVNLAAHKISE